jgi:hypothetical protein
MVSTTILSYIVNARLQPHAYAQSAARLGLYLATRARSLPPPRHPSHDIYQIHWHLLPSLRNPRSIQRPTLARHQPRPRLRPSRLPRALVIDIMLMFITVTPNARRRFPTPRTAAHRAPIARARVIPQHRTHRARARVCTTRTPQRRAAHEECEPSRLSHSKRSLHRVGVDKEFALTFRAIRRRRATRSARTHARDTLARTRCSRAPHRWARHRARRRTRGRFVRIRRAPVGAVRTRARTRCASCERGRARARARARANGVLGAARAGDAGCARVRGDGKR